MIDAAPINTFQPWGNATLAMYPNEQADMKAAVVRYLASDYEIVDQRIYVAGAFSRVLQSDMHDVLVKKVGATVIDQKIPEGLGNIRIWKRGKEYFALASSWIIYPGANAIYGYYQLRRRHRRPEWSAGLIKSSMDAQRRTMSPSSMDTTKGSPRD